MSERAKLYRTMLSGVMVLTTVGCLGSEPNQSIAPIPVHDRSTRALLRLDWDSDGDGRIDQRTYVAGATPLRSELDTDDDGRVDRWEYVRPSGQLSHLGSSSANDGIEDTWLWPAINAGETRVDRAQYRDRVVDRREYYRRDVLGRVEEDANRDGLVDKWETWDAGVLRLAAYDTTFSGRSPDRRLVYDDRGRFAYVEADSDGKGRFERLTVPDEPMEREDIRD